MKAEKIVIVLGILLFMVLGLFVLFALLGGGFDIDDEQIALIRLEGEIGASDDLFSFGVSSEDMKALFDEARQDDSIKAVVLAIDSPGGGVVETKEIARSLDKLAAEKSVVVWVGSVGASGAYYVASFADHIVADSDSLVGSIGVISIYSIYKDLFEEKLGINTTVIKSGEYKDIGSPFRAMTDEEREMLQEIVDEVNERFIQTLIVNRGLSEDQVAELREANLMLGTKALELGLVDELGGLDDAVAVARLYASAPDAELVTLEEGDLFSELFGMSYAYSVGRGIGDSIGDVGATASGRSLTLDY